MKKFAKILTVVLAAAAVATASGCAKKTTSRKVATTANWNARTAVSVEGNSVEFWKTHKEVAEYALSFTPNSTKGFNVSYDTETAVYSTAFYLEEYDWTDTGIPESYRKTENTTEPVYVYETSLKISGVYQSSSSEEKHEFEDVRQSVCKFRLAGYNLQPVYSRQFIKNTAPNAVSSDKLSNSYVEVDEIYENFYNPGCTHVITKYTDMLTNSSEAVKAEKKITDKSNYSVFDNSQINAAVRAMTFTSGATRLFNVVTPQNDTVTAVTASIGTPAELDKEAQSGIISALDNCYPYIFFDGTVENSDSVRVYRYTPVTLSVNSDMNGPSPTYWYSTVENADANATRCVLLRFSTPLSFGMGTLVYSLKSLKLINV